MKYYVFIHKTFEIVYNINCTTSSYIVYWRTFNRLNYRKADIKHRGIQNFKKRRDNNDDNTRS